MDAPTQAFFQTLKARRPEDGVCVDCGSAHAVADWASVSHGVFMCLNCSGRHRGFGVHISFVRSVGMDTWKPAQLRAMELGGNARFRRFAEERGLGGLPSVDMYNSPAAAEYRSELKALISPTAAVPEPALAAPKPVRFRGPEPQAASASPQEPRRAPAQAPAAAPKPALPSQKPAVDLWGDDFWE